MRMWIILAIGALASLGGSAQGMAIEPPLNFSPLEGTQWVVRVVPATISQQQGEASFEETLVFENGKVRMLTRLKHGFGPSAYTTVSNQGGWSFSVEQASAEEGRTMWTALVIEQDIKGTMVWSKKNGRAIHYAFEGKRSAGVTAANNAQAEMAAQAHN